MPEITCAKEGLNNAAVMNKLSITGTTVCKWRERYVSVELAVARIELAAVNPDVEMAAATRKWKLSWLIRMKIWLASIRRWKQF
jgi:hypothetical protein